MNPTSPSTPHPELVEGALVVPLARPAEFALEQIVGLKLREHARSLPLSIAQDPGNGQLGVVVQDGSGDAAEEGECRVVAIAECLGRLRRIGLHEATIIVGKIEGKEVDLPCHAADHRHRFAEVRLGVTGRMDERHEHLTRPKPPLADPSYAPSLREPSRWCNRP